MSADSNSQLKTCIQIRDIDYSRVINKYDRSYGIQKIFNLHEQKDYKNDTLFTAVSIFDRYLSSIGVENFQK